MEPRCSLPALCPVPAGVCLPLPTPCEMPWSVFILETTVTRRLRRARKKEKKEKAAYMKSSMADGNTTVTNYGTTIEGDDV
ncbi:hypothetical protein O3P69_000333 [Scylla paramamosain]|uniref:Uncharacterized protein n=1 Tax=Scylla paramamosain TaxID=85552 RepID=A0AAW0UXE2_SCYPA